MKWTVVQRNESKTHEHRCPRGIEANGRFFCCGMSEATEAKPGRWRRSEKRWTDGFTQLVRTGRLRPAIIQGAWFVLIPFVCMHCGESKIEKGSAES